jgi:syntaxin 1B/2/3
MKVNPDVTEEELSQALMDPNTQIFQQALMSSTRSSQARTTLAEVQSRHNDILSIERKVQELAQLLNELAVMIELQEVQIDHVDQHAAQVSTTMGEGVEKISQATKLARAVRRKKWWCFLICLIIIAAIVIAVVVTQVHK